MGEDIIVAFHGCMARETFAGEIAVFTVRILVHTLPACKTPAAGILPFLVVLEHKLGMNKFAGNDSFFPCLQRRIFPDHLSEDSTVWPGVCVAGARGVDCDVVTKDYAQGVVVDAA